LVSEVLSATVIRSPKLSQATEVDLAFLNSIGYTIAINQDDDSNPQVITDSYDYHQPGLLSSNRSEENIIINYLIAFGVSIGSKAVMLIAIGLAYWNKHRN